MRQEMAKELSNMYLEELAQKIKAAPDMGTVREILDNSVSESRKRISEGADMFPDQKSMETFAEDDVLALRPMREAVKDELLRLIKETTLYPQLYQDAGYANFAWKDYIAPKTFFCSIHLKSTGTFVGYCGVKDAEQPEWELAIELLREHHRQGYAYRAMKIFMERLVETTGRRSFIAQVTPDNIASLQLMEKLGGTPKGIDTFLIDDEERLKKIEKKNADKIDDRLTALARRFHVEPRTLLTHVVVYRFSV